MNWWLGMLVGMLLVLGSVMGSIASKIGTTNEQLRDINAHLAAIEDYADKAEDRAEAADASKHIENERFTVLSDALNAPDRRHR